MKQRRRIYYLAASGLEIWELWQAGKSMSPIDRQFDREVLVGVLGDLAGRGIGRRTPVPALRQRLHSRWTVSITSGWSRTSDGKTSMNSPILARSCAPCGVHAILEHAEVRSVGARDRVLHLLEEAVTRSGAGRAFSELAEPDVGLPGHGRIVRARKRDRPLIRRRVISQESVLHHRRPSNARAAVRTRTSSNLALVDTACARGIGRPSSPIGGKAKRTITGSVTTGFGKYF